MNTDDDARCREIERRLNNNEYRNHDDDECRDYPDHERDIHFLLDLARTADAMLRTAFLDNGLDADALLAEAEKRAALECREMFVKYNGFSARHAAHAITAAFNLPPLEEPGR